MTVLSWFKYQGQQHVVNVFLARKFLSFPTELTYACSVLCLVRQYWDKLKVVCLRQDVNVQLPFFSLMHATQMWEFNPWTSGLRQASAYVFCPLMLSAVLTKALESRGCLVLILHAPWWLTVLWFGINDRLVPCQAISPLGVGCGIYSALQAVRDSCKPFCKNSLEFLGLWKPLTAVVGVMCPLFWHWIGL